MQTCGPESETYFTRGNGTPTVGKKVSWQTVSCELPLPASSPPRGLGEPPSKRLPVKAQVMKDITSEPQQGPSTGRTGKAAGVTTRTCSIPPGQRGEEHGHNFVSESHLDHEFLIFAPMSWIKRDIQ